MTGMSQMTDYFFPGNPRPRVLILANGRKEAVSDALAEFRPWLEPRARIVDERDTREVSRQAVSDLPEADLALVLGGDGTLLSQARLLVDHGAPLLGVNFGKVGFLAEFSIESIKAHWEAIVGGQCRMSRRMMLDVAVFSDDAPEWGDNGATMPEPMFQTVAMNDVVVTAGPPYRMVEIELAIEPGRSRTSATTFMGDGVIVSTPSGSTAYNLAAGGPIVSPGIHGICVSAMCPQSLAFRPIVYNADCETWLAIRRANEGTTLVIDGQESCMLEHGQQVRIVQYPRSLSLVHNPDFNYWKMLAHKMHWAARPRRD